MSNKKYNPVTMEDVIKAIQGKTITTISDEPVLQHIGRTGIRIVTSEGVEVELFEHSTTGNKIYMSAE